MDIVVLDEDEEAVFDLRGELNEVDDFSPRNLDDMDNAERRKKLLARGTKGREKEQNPRFSIMMRRRLGENRRRRTLCNNG